LLDPDLERDREIAKREILGLLAVSQPSKSTSRRKRYYHPNEQNPMAFLAVVGKKITTVVYVSPEEIRARANERRDTRWFRKHRPKCNKPGNGREKVWGSNNGMMELDEEFKTESAVFEEEEL